MIKNVDHKKEAASKKLEQDRLQIILNELLKDEENKYCADCEAKGPRWASWNLGVFLCIRCAGIHRNLGVHVSKVKSVNLDTWTVEQVQSVRVFGNSVAKAVYEAHLPEHFRRPQTDSTLETFIRAKYEQKRYAMKDWQPSKVDFKPLLTELENFHSRKKISSSPALSSLDKTAMSLSASDQKSRTPKSSGSNRQASTERRRRTKTNSTSEDGRKNEPESDDCKAKTKTTNGATSLADDLLGLTMTTNNTGLLIDDFSHEFGSFTMAPQQNLTPGNDANSISLKNQNDLADLGGEVEKTLLDTSAKGANEKKTTGDILALYGSSSSLNKTAPNVNLCASQSSFGGLAQQQQTNLGLLTGLQQQTSFGHFSQQPTQQNFGQMGQNMPFMPASNVPANFAAFNPFNQQPLAQPQPANFNFAPPTGAEQALEQSARLKAVQDQLASLQSQKSVNTSNRSSPNAMGSSAGAAGGSASLANTVANDLWQ